MSGRFHDKHHRLPDILLFIQIFFWINMVVLMLRLLSLSKIMSLLTPKRQAWIRASKQPNLIRKVAGYTDFILMRNWWIYRMNCLKRALVIYRIMRLNGLAVEICIGVKKQPSIPVLNSENPLIGHAWLRFNGKPFLEDSRSMATTYTCVVSFPTVESDGHANVY